MRALERENEKLRGREAVRERGTSSMYVTPEEEVRQATEVSERLVWKKDRGPKRGGRSFMRICP